MPDTPLNPDALEVGAQSMECQCSKHVIDCGEYYADCPRHGHYPKAVSAYLAVAQPEVNSVEELDALPAGTLVKSGGREFYKTSYIDLPWILPYGVDRFGSSYLAKHSKVTVIHRPEVKP